MEVPKIQLPPLGFVDRDKVFSQLPQHVSVDDIVALFIVAFITGALWYAGIFGERPDPFLHALYDRPQEHMGNNGAAKGTRDIAEKLNHIQSNIAIFWGSQSGTAERFANRLAKEIRQRFGRKALAADASDYESASIKNLPDSSLAVFIVSTFGEGDPSDNIQDLWHWLETTKGSPMKNLHYAALGLGNSNYKYFNAVVDIVSQKLNTLGAQALLPIGKADDAQGQTEEHYLEFKAQLFQLLKSQMGFEEREPVYEPAIKVVEDPSLEPIYLHQGEPWTPNRDRKTARIVSPVHSLPVKATRELFDHPGDRNCIHMELDLSQYPTLKYKTGDHLGVWAANPKPEVVKLLQALGKLNARDTPISLASLDPETKLKVPTPTSLQALFSNYLEICAAVPRETVAQLVQFAPSQQAKDQLNHLAASKMAYDDLAAKMYLNLPRLLEHVAQGDGAWKNLPVSFVVEILPAMQPRYYSISSSSVVHARQVAITAVVSKKRMQDGAIVPGICTNHLLGLQRSFLGQPSPLPSETRVFAHVRKSTFKMPATMAHPIIMVAAGTGIAPFRAFLHERARLSKMGREIGRTILFFGCRNEMQDFLYADELREWAEMPEMNLKIVTAFSRPDSGSKAYVQDRVKQHADEVCDLVREKEASFYICGSAAMARDVSKVVGEELQQRKGLDDVQLRAFMDQQKRIRKWQQDVWG